MNQIDTKTYSETDSTTKESYNRFKERLEEERIKLGRDIVHGYRNARRYARSNTEQGLAIAFIAGILVGIWASKCKK